MHTFMHYPRLLTALACGLALGACATPPQDDPFTRVDGARTQTMRQSTVTQASLVKTARTGRWLDERVTAYYKNVPAQAAIEAALGNRPVRFALLDASRVTVSSPPDAKTIRAHLDAIMVQANWAYTVQQNTIVVSDIEQRFFDIAIVPATREAKMTLRNLQNVQGGEGATNTAELQLSPQTAIPEAIPELTSGQLGTPPAPAY